MMARLPRLKLSVRLGIAIILAVLASFLLDQALRVMIPPPPFLMVERDWLVGAVAREAKAPVEAVRDAEAAGFLEYRMSVAPPLEQGGRGAEFGRGLRIAIAAALGQPEDDVRVWADRFSDNAWERSSDTAVAIIPKVPTLLTAEELASNRSSVLGRLEIAIRRADGQWLVVTARRTTDARWHQIRMVLTFAGNFLILMIFSIWMARSIVAPLTRLANAAERLGRDREPTLIGDMRLPEFAAIAGTFNAMQLRLKRFVDERVQMLAAISHDLRTPLTRLRLLAEYIEDEDQRTQLRSNVAEMETMVTDALAFMREEASQEPMETVDLAALLISLADTHHDLGDDVLYEGPDHLDIRCRPVAIRRAFANLIANGCKYGEAVHIVLEAEEGWASIAFRDRGPGIPPEEAERAFAPFVRLESSRGRETGGTGLGLTISRDAVRSHGGEIGFEHGGRGFTVRVRLPRER
jgi:signal transduction histidine kinase